MADDKENLPPHAKITISEPPQGYRLKGICHDGSRTEYFTGEDRIQEVDNTCTGKKMIPDGSYPHTDLAITSFFSLMATDGGKDIISFGGRLFCSGVERGLDFKEFYETNIETYKLPTDSTTQEKLHTELAERVDEICSGHIKKMIKGGQNSEQEAPSIAPNAKDKEGNVMAPTS